MGTVLDENRQFFYLCGKDDIFDAIARGYPELRPATKEEMEEFFQVFREKVENGTYKTYIIDTTNKEISKGGCS